MPDGAVTAEAGADLAVAREALKLHKEAFRCAFDYLNGHYPPGDDPEWWVDATKDATDVSVAHGDNPLVNGLLIGVIGYLEKIYKERRGENG